MRSCFVSLIMIIALIGSSLLLISSLRQTQADILTNAAIQRKGNYNIYMKTVPPNPVAGQLGVGQCDEVLLI